MHRRGIVGGGGSSLHVYVFFCADNVRLSVLTARSAPCTLPGVNGSQVRSLNRPQSATEDFFLVHSHQRAMTTPKVADFIGVSCLVDPERTGTCRESSASTVCKATAFVTHLRLLRDWNCGRRRRRKRVTKRNTCNVSRTYRAGRGPSASPTTHLECVQFLLQPLVRKFGLLKFVFPT